MTRCDYCGFEFDPAYNETGGCAGCPLAGGCSKITCPRCGYQMLPEAKLIGWLRKAQQNWRARKEKSHEAK